MIDLLGEGFVRHVCAMSDEEFKDFSCEFINLEGIPFAVKMPIIYYLCGERTIVKLVKKAGDGDV